MGRRNTSIVLLACVVFAWRIWVARHASFWCDELGWIRDSLGFAHFFRHVQAEGPLGPFDPFGIVFLGQAFHFGGWIHPHVSFRVFTLTLSALTAFSGFWLLGRKSPLASAWCVWALTHTTIHAMAANARSYMSPIFFGSLGVLLASHYEEIPKRRVFWAVFLIAIVGGLSQPYVDFVHVALGAALCVGLLGGRRIDSQQGKLILCLLGGVALTVFWLTVAKTSQAPVAKPWSVVLSLLLKENWLVWLKDNLHAFAGVGASLLYFLPLWVLGIWHVYRVGNRRFWVYGAVMLALALFVPPVLALRHGYFFVPRQSFAAVPVFGYLAVQGGAFIFQSSRGRSGALGLACLAVFAAYAVGTALSNRHWMANVPPFVDMPRYTLETTVPDLAGPQQLPVVVLSQCHWGVAQLYSSKANFDRFFDHLMKWEAYDFEKHSKGVLLWTQDVQSCFGVLKDHGDSAALDTALRVRPQEFAVLAFQGLRAPPWIPQRCRYEYGAPCLREE